MNLRKLNATLHRDIGYLAVGLTVVYALSGIAINHIADWNPNYRKTEQALQIEPLDIRLSQQELTESACRQLGLPLPRAAFQPNENTLQLIYGGQAGRTFGVDLPTGKVIMQESQPRPVLYALNRLHLNAPKKLWTYIADLYSVSLLFLAISGLFIVRGKNGIIGRGAWLTSIGILIPASYWVWWINR
ncbi:MAG: PepSY-associated TM helix domain-containing protein [Holophagaceae bacterium]|nr:PepSY-associated TM helix domain-containing protein [Holophagaceae bacterium]